MLLAITLKIESRNDRFTSARSSYYKVAEVSMHITLHIKLFQYFLLVVLGSHQVKSRKVKQGRFPVCAQSFLQPFVTLTGYEIFECCVAPIGFKRMADLFYHFWQLKLCSLEIPFFTIFQCVSGKVARTNIRSVKTRIAEKNIRLGVQTVLGTVIRNFNLCIG